MKQAFLLLTIALASGLFTVSTDGATITWASGTSGNWSSPTNWNPNQVPGSSDTAVITASGNYTVNVDTTVTVSGLVLGSSDATRQTLVLYRQSMAITQSTTVNSNGVINMISGALTCYNGDGIMNGTLTCSGGTLSGVLTIGSNAVVNLASTLAGTQTVNFAALTLTNYGTVVWSNLDIQCTSPPVEIDNYNLLNIQSENTFTGDSGTTINNYGTIRKNIGTYAPPNYITRFNTTTLNNSGTVDVEMGAINFSGGNGGGLFNTGTNAGLALGNFTLTGDTTFSGPGQVQGTLYGQSGTIHGSMAFDYGSFSGTLNVATDGVLNLVGIRGETTPIGLNYLSLTNFGTVIWSNIDLDCTDAQIYNHGLWDVQSNNTVYGNTGGGPYISTFNNFGTVRKDGGTWGIYPQNPLTLFDNSVTFNNSGAIIVEVGGINLSTGNGGGFFNTASNAGLSLGNFTLTGDATFAGPGAVQGTLYGQNGIIHGSLPFDYGSLSGTLAVATDGVLNLVGINGETTPITLTGLSLTNCGTVVWSNINLNCSSVLVYNHGLWDAQSDNTFYGNAGGGLSMSTFNNYGTVRKDGGTTITHFDSATTFINSGTVDVETDQINIDNGTGGGLFNTANNAIVWLGIPNGFDLSGDVTFTGPGLVGGNLYGYPNGGAIHGSLNFYYGSLGGSLTIASNAVADLIGFGGPTQPLDLDYLSLTNCGTVTWNNVDLDGSGTQIYNHGLWDALSDNTFYGNSSGGLSVSTFNNYGTVRKDGGMTITHFDSATTFINYGTVDVETDQINIDNGTGGGLFNTASNAIVWLGIPNGFDLSGDVTFTGPGLVGGNLYGYPNGGAIHGSLNFYYGSLGGSLTVASNAVANLIGFGGPTQPLDLDYLSLTNCGTVTWNNVDLDGSGTQIYNHGLWDALSDNTFYGNSGGGQSVSTFNNYGTVRKDGGTTITHFDSATTFINTGTVDVEAQSNNSGTGNVGGVQINIDAGTASGGLFNTASNDIVWLGIPNGFDLSGNVTFTGPGLVGGNLYGYPNGGAIQGSLNFYYGSLGGSLTVASNAVANLIGFGGPTQPLDLDYLSLTNCGTVTWNNVDLDGSGTQIYNHGLWDALSDNTFYGNSGGGLSMSTFNNYGTVRKDGGSTITVFDSATTFTNSGTVDVETAQININSGAGGGLFNTASNAIVWLGVPNAFDLSGNTTFSGPGLVGGNLYGYPNGGVIQGTLNFYYGSLGGSLTVASNAVANLIGFGGPTQPLDLNYLSLTNCGTVLWTNIDLDCSGVQIYNHGLWDAQSDNTFFGDSSGSPYISTFNNSGTVRKDGGSGITTFDYSTTFNNSGKTDVQMGQVTLDGSCSLTNGTLNFGISGPSQFGSIDFLNYVQLAGRLSVNFTNHYTPVASNSFPVVAYSLEAGGFSSTCLPPLSSGLFWQTNYTSSGFTLNVVAAGPLKLSTGLSVGGNSMSLSWYGVLGQTYQVQCATNLAPAIWVDLGGPIIGTNGPIAVLDSFSASPQKYYRIQSQ